jgi:hypothetical protein
VCCCQNSFSSNSIQPFFEIRTQGAASIPLHTQCYTAMQQLVSDASKSRSKKDRAKQRAEFRTYMSTVEVFSSSLFSLVRRAGETAREDGICFYMARVSLLFWSDVCTKACSAHWGFFSFWRS